MSEHYALSPQQAHLCRLLVAEGELPDAWIRLRVSGRVTPSRVEQAIAALVERHEALRTVCCHIGTARPWQVVLPATSPPALRCAITRDEGDLIVELRAPALVVDRFGLRTVAEELHALLAHPKHPLPPVAMQGLDAAAFHEDQLTSADNASARDHWRAQRLAGGGWAPWNNRRAAPPRMFAEHRTLSDACSRLLRERGSLGVEDTVLAAWTYVIGRLGASVHVAVRADGRRFRELEGAVGVLSRDLPLRLALAPEETLHARAHRAGIQRQLNLAHQDGFSYDASWEPGLAQTLRRSPIGLVVTQGLRLSEGGVSLVLEDEADCVDLHDATLEVRDDDGVPISMVLRIDTGRVAFADLSPLLDQLVEVLEGVALNADEPLGRSRHVPPPLPSASQTLRPTRTVLEAIAAVVDASPDMPATEHRGQARTYVELWRRAHGVAHWLSQARRAPHQPVVIDHARSHGLLEAVLGAWLAGHPVAIFDRADPRRRLQDRIDALAPAAVVVDDSSRLADIAGTPTLRVGTVAAIDPPPFVAPYGGAAAYVIHTSGSTGVPKATEVSHDALATYLEWAASAYSLDRGSRSVVFTSLAVDLTLTSLLAPLLVGGIVELLDEEPGFAALAQRLTSAVQIDLLKATPSQVNLLATLDAGAARVASVQTMILGGEALDETGLRQCRTVLAPERIYNEYGPTEATVGCTVFDATERQTPGPVPIGSAVAGASVHVLDRNLQPVPTWVPGELFIGGPTLATSYRGAPDVTADRFVPDPFSGAPGSRLYRTGDLARRHPDGTLEFLHRLDDQLKVRGHRVEPGEITAALRGLPGVAAAAVTATLTPDGSPRLVAHVAPMAGFDCSERDVAARLSELLPPYMVPTVRVVPSLPTTVAGKVDLARLERNAAATPERAMARNVDEEVLASVFVKVLGVAAVAPTDGFFVLGGDSIRAIQLVAEARRRGLILSLEQVFRCRTPRAIVADLGRGDAAQSVVQPQPFELLDDDTVRRLPAGLDDAYPLTALQAGMVFHVEAEPGTAIYHDVATYRIRDAFDEVAFRSALTGLHQRHPVLRTSFELAAHPEPVQYVHAHVEPQLVVVDVRGLSPAEADREIEAWFETEKTRGFDMTRAPLVRFQVHVRGAGETQLSVSFHHAILDGWSDASMLTELYLAYSAARRGAPREIAAPACRFSTQVALERTSVSSAEDCAYWRTVLAQAPRTRLPRWPDGATTDARRAVFAVPVVISEEVSRRLRDLAAELAVPLKSVLLAAHVRVLAAFAGSDDVVTCMSSSGRPEIDDGDRALGLFLNSLPIRVQTSAASWAGLADAALAAERDAMPHRRYPYAAIKRWLGTDPSDVAFYFTHYHVYEALRHEGGVEVIGFDVYEETSFTVVANFSLSAMTGRVRLHLTCDRRVVPSGQAEQLAVAYERALTAVAKTPWARPAALDVTTDVARTHAMRRRADEEGVAAVPALETLLERLSARPDAIAVESGHATCSYRALADRADQIAASVQAAGLGTDDVVAIALTPGFDLVAATLGVLRAGCAYLPLDPGTPPQRALQMFDAARPALLLTSSTSPLAHLPKVPRCDLDAPLLAAHFFTRLVPCNALAYVMFTSGSTGAPKGVLITREGLASYLTAALQRYPLDGRVPLVSSASVDLTVTSLLGTILAGGTLVIPPGATSAEALLAAFTSEAAFDFAKLTPSQARLVAGLRNERQLPLRALVLGGEALRADDISSWTKLAPGAALWNEYGPTEAVVGCAAYQVPAGALATEDVPIGDHMNDAELLVLDAHLRPVPTGTPGELYIGGPALARGYVAAADTTADRFVPHPWSRLPGARLYRTGDLVTTASDGALTFIGRRDQQVKLRGYRVELGEIEAALVSCGGVDAAAVRFRPTADGGELDAFIVASIPVDRGALFEELGRRLPSPLLPSSVTEVHALPRTPAGKLDRSALPAAGPTTGGATYHPPRDPLEEVLTRLWSETLRVPRVGIHESFAELGGHSILAVQLVARVRETLNVDLPLRDLLDAATVAELAAAIRRRAGEAPPPRPVRVLPDPDRWFDPFPLTDVQHAYWVGRSGALELGSVGSHLYMEVEGNLDAGRLQTAIRELVRRHPMLRAIVHPDGRQQVLPTVPEYVLTAADLRDVEASQRDRDLLAVREQMSHHVLPTDRWPIFEVRHYRVTDDVARVCFSMDALMADAWSMRLLARDLFRLHRGDELPPPAALTFRDYVVGTSAASTSELVERARAYWWARLEDLPAAPELPLRADAAQLWRRPRFVRIGGRVEQQAWSRFKRCAARHGVTTTCALLATFAETLGIYARQRRFTLNLTLYNRMPVHRDVNEVAGDFTTLNLLECDVRGSAAFGSRARATQRRLWDDLDHRHVTGVEVLRELARRRQLGLRATMPVVFTSTLNLRELQGEDWIPRDIRSIFSLTQTPQVWLDHQVSEEEGELVVNWDVVEGLFPDGLMNDLLASYLAAIVQLCSGEDAWLADLGEWLSTRAGDRWTELQATSVAVVPQRLELGLFTNARTSPQRPAVVAQDATLSYAELAERASAVAQLLRTSGVVPGELVAVLAARGSKQASAVFGALRAGAAYVPIDPEWPRARIESLFQRAGVRIALVDDAGAALAPENAIALSIPTTAATSPDPDGDTDGLAYVIYTSGSTGEPKGVRLSHRGAWNTLDVVNRRWNIGADDAVLALSSLTFDLSVYDLFGMAAAGGRIVMPDARRWRDPAHWADLVGRERVTIWNSVPALMELLVEHAETRSDRPLASLRLVLLSGDWIPVDLPARIRRAVGSHVHVVSLGGATEGAVWSIAHDIVDADALRVSIPYGRALANQRIHVWDDDLRERATWATGELYIAGDGVADGYHNAPELTAARFVAHPRGTGRVYRTGDLGRHLPDGSIEFLGREDQQVKVAGHRIELGEIEAALRRSEDVADAVALATGARGAADRRLAAFVVAAPGRSPSVDELREQLRSILPAYMVPSRIELLDRLPVTANGKIDRAALAVSAPESSERPVTAPRTPLERRVASAWADILDARAPDIDTDFFDAGGNSLRAIQMLSRLRADLDIRLPLERLLEHPTIATLATAIEEELIERLEQMTDTEAARLLATLGKAHP